MNETGNHLTSISNISSLWQSWSELKQSPVRSGGRAPGTG